MKKEISIESQKALMLARYDAICDILEGLEVSEFMESFPEVRRVADLYAASQQAVQADACLCGICAKKPAIVCGDCAGKYVNKRTAQLNRYLQEELKSHVGYNFCVARFKFERIDRE